MKAHFAVDEIEREKEPSLQDRIEEFKNDSENMDVLVEFVNDVLKTAEVEADKKQLALQQESAEKARKQSFNISDFRNGKVVNRARGLVVRLFDAICNCANTAAAPAQRIRGKRSTASAKQ